MKTKEVIIPKGTVFKNVPISVKYIGNFSSPSKSSDFNWSVFVKDVLRGNYDDGYRNIKEVDFVITYLDPKSFNFNKITKPITITNNGFVVDAGSRVDVVTNKDINYTIKDELEQPIFYNDFPVHFPEDNMIKPSLPINNNSNVILPNKNINNKITLTPEQRKAVVNGKIKGFVLMSIIPLGLAHYSYYKEYSFSKGIGVVVIGSALAYFGVVVYSISRK